MKCPGTCCFDVTVRGKRTDRIGSVNRVWEPETFRILKAAKQLWLIQPSLSPYLRSSTCVFRVVAKAWTLPRE